jgi:hypothetical protein
MRNRHATRAGSAWLLGYASPVFALTAEASSSEVLVGLLLVVGFVVLVYGLVLLVKYLSGSKQLRPDRLSAAEFDGFNRPSDDPSFTFPNSWSRRK